MIIGPALVRTIRDFFPEFNTWLDRLPDSRVQEQCTYERRLLAWQGIMLFVLQLGSRRQLDFDLDAHGTQVVPNLNQLAGTDHSTRPVNGTLEHFLDHSKPDAIGALCPRMVQRLIRMKYLDSARLQGHFVAIFDATGLFAFPERHCPHCLEQQHETHAVYMHKVLEAKLLGPEGMVFSIGSEFIENADAPVQPCSAEAFKQDCELKAFSRLAPNVKRSFPQLRLCLAGDSIFACGRVLKECQDNNWSYVLTLKEGHMPAVWRDFQSLLPLCPENTLEQTISDAKGKTVHQLFRWVHELSYQDGEGRSWTFTGLLCQETVDGETTTFAWITDLAVNKNTVVEVATKGGRCRWKIENQGFNREKNSGMNLEHLYSKDPENLKAYYYLLQIAHIILLLLENGKQLRQMASAWGKSPVEWFGSLKNIARRLLESLRYVLWRAAGEAEATGAVPEGIIPNTS